MKKILFILFFIIIQNNAYATVPVKNAYTNVAVNVCTPSDSNIFCSGGGGVGVGTVNTGSQFQVGYYANTGTTISGSSILSVNSSNVGIGSVNPQQKLDVNGSVILSNSGGGTITTLQSIAGAQSKDLTITTGVAGTQTGNIGIGPQSGASVNGDINIIGQGTSGQTKGSDITITAGNGSAHKGIISITSPGNVGIGTIFPIQALDIIGTTRMTSFLMPTGASSGYVLTSNSVGLGTWAPSTGSGSGTVGSGTINQEAVYTGSTTTGSGIITDDSTNIGIGTSTNLRNKLDVNGNMDARGNITIKHSTNNNLTYDGTLDAVGSLLYPDWLNSNGIESGISANPIKFVNSVASTSNGPLGAQGLWNCNDTTAYTFAVSGITTPPTTGAVYGIFFNYHVLSISLTGSPGSYAGTITTNQAGGAPGTSSGTLTKGSGTGDATIAYSAWKYGGCDGPFVFLGGITAIGDESVPEYNSKFLTDIDITLNGNPANYMRPSAPGAGIDSAIRLVNYNMSPESSGISYSFKGVDENNVIFDSIAASLNLAKPNGLYSADPAYYGIIWNTTPNKLKGFIISSPSVSGLGGGDNNPFLVADAEHQVTSFPLWQQYVATPDDVVYKFNGITGLSVTPSIFGSQYTISGARCDVRDVSGISGGAGNIIMTCQGGTPSASGTLARFDTIRTSGSFISTGDVSIPYTSVTNLRNGGVDTMVIDALHNKIGIGTSAPTQMLDVVGTAKAITFIGDGTQLTGIPISTGISGLGTGVATFLATPSSANLASAITNETGSGALVFGTSPTLVTPALGTPASGVATNLTGTAASLTSGITNALASATTTVNVSSATAPSSGQVLTATSSTAATWQPPSGGASGWTLGASNVGISTTNNVGIGTNLTTMAGLTVMNGNVGIGTWIPSAPLDIVGSGNAYFGGNVGIGSLAPNASLDLGTSGTIVSHRTTGLGFSEHNATNQACNTTCGSSACVIGLDIGTVGVVNSGFVACTDATADDCLCAGP